MPSHQVGKDTILYFVGETIVSEHIFCLLISCICTLEVHRLISGKQLSWLVQLIRFILAEEDAIDIYSHRKATVELAFKQKFFTWFCDEPMAHPSYSSLLKTFL